MRFCLSNEHRKYMGLDLVLDNWDVVEYKNGDNDEFYLYFDNNIIKKVVHYYITDDFIQLLERDVYYKTKNNRKIVIFDTSSLFERKLDGSVIDALFGNKNYFAIYKQKNELYAHVVIGNYSNGRRYYHDENIEDCFGEDDFKKWCDSFIKNRNEDDIKDVNSFKNSKCKYVDYREGDYFRVDLGKNIYSYGRILLDVSKNVKNKTLNYFNVLMGNVVVIEMFHIITDKKNVSIEELKKLKRFPSQHLMDNYLYSGEYEIIGNSPIYDVVLYPIMYGRGFNEISSSKIIFQCGYIHKEIDFDSEKYVGQYLNNSVGFMVDGDYNTFEKCVIDKSNDYYWKQYSFKKNNDLRHPDNKNKLIEVLNQFDLNELKELYLKQENL